MALTSIRSPILLVLLALGWASMSGAGGSRAATLPSSRDAAPGGVLAAGFYRDQLAPGMFLVASPDLRDPNFAETVVLLIEYTGAGAMGVVINRPTSHTLASVLPDVQSLQGREDSLYVGGPVGTDRLLLLFRASDALPDSQHVVDDIYVSASQVVLEQVFEHSDSSRRVHAFVGYAGWGPGQLDDETDRGGWRVIEADAATVFELDPPQMWPELIKRTTGLWTMAAS